MIELHVTLTMLGVITFFIVNYSYNYNYFSNFQLQLLFQIFNYNY